MNRTTFAAIGAAASAIALSSPASAAQIVLTPSMIIGVSGAPYTHPGPMMDQQGGPVTTAGSAWVGGFGALVTLDLGRAYQIGSFDFFTTDTIKVAVTGANALSFLSDHYFIAGPTSLLTDSGLVADAGDPAGTLTAQNATSLDRTGTFRYLQVQLTDAVISRNYVLNELKVFDAATPAVPEPATWAMMIAGFGLIGGAMRRKPRLAGMPALG